MFYSFALTWNSAGGKIRKNLSNSLTSFDQKKTDSLLLDLLLVFYKPRLENKENKLQTHWKKKISSFWPNCRRCDVWIFWTTIFKNFQIWQIGIRLGWVNDLGEHRKLSFISRLWAQFFWNAGGILRFRLVGWSFSTFISHQEETKRWRQVWHALTEKENRAMKRRLSVLERKWVVGHWVCVVGVMDHCSKACQTVL